MSCACVHQHAFELELANRGLATFSVLALIDRWLPHRRHVNIMAAHSDSSGVAVRSRQAVVAGQVDDWVVLETKLTLFDGPAGEDHAQVWLEPAGAGVILRTQEWGSGVDRNFGWNTIETSLTIGGPELFTLAFALVVDHPELDLTASPIELLAAAYRGDSAASANVRTRLEELGLTYDFSMR